MAITSDKDDGLPVVSPYIASASPHNEIVLAEAILSKCFVYNEKPERLIGEDKTYDSDPLDEKLAFEYSIEMISPHRVKRKRSKKTQDVCRPPRHCYKHRR
jgi:hypothetical protein